MTDNRREALTAILQTLQRIRAEKYPHVPASLVNRIMEVELANEDSPRSALPDIEAEVTKASRGSSGQ